MIRELVLVLAAAGVLLAGPAAGAVPASLYPFERDGVPASDVSFVESAVRAVLSSRGADVPFTLSPDGTLKANCGPASSRPAACLAGHRRRGVVVSGVVSRIGKSLFVGLFVFGAGTSYGPVQVALSRSKSDGKVLADALRVLAGRLATPTAPAPVSAAPAEYPAAPALPAAATATTAAVTAPPAARTPSGPPLPVPPVAIPPPPPASPLPHAWLAGTLAVAGAAGLAGSWFAIHDARAIDADLRTRFAGNGLRAADREKYDLLESRTRTGNVLLVTGTVLLVGAGAVLGRDLLVGPGGVSGAF